MHSSTSRYPGEQSQSGAGFRRANMPWANTLGSTARVDEQVDEHASQSGE